jgi:hypothetical protein
MTTLNLPGGWSGLDLTQLQALTAVPLRAA